MAGTMLNILICQILIGATFPPSSEAVDSQMLSFLLNEMSNFRTMTLDMQHEIKALKSTVSNLTSKNDHLQRMVTSLESKTKHLEQELVNNVSKLTSDIITVDRATNTSVLFIQLEEKIFEQRIEEELRNMSAKFNAKLNSCKYIHLPYLTKFNFLHTIYFIPIVKSFLAH
jgi:chromosome segregation ATPase